MATTITVLYENLDDATFDLDYYMTRHMPMVGEKLGPHGLKGWRVVRAVSAPGGGKLAFSMMATLEFDTVEQFKAATSAEGRAVFGDVPNFTNKQPLVVIGEVVGAG